MGSSDPPRLEILWLTERLLDSQTRLACLVGLGWLLVGLAAGTSQMAALRLSGTPAGAAFAPPLLASAVWIPITLVGMRLARRYPLRWPPGAIPLAIHAVGALAVSFVLNAGYTVAAVAIGLQGSESLPRSILSAGLYWLHVNAGVYLTIVASASWMLVRPDPPDALPPDRLRADAGGRTELVPVDEVDWIEGAGDYARLHVGDRDLLCSRRLKELERSLRPAHFVRIHRSAIVNVARIRGLEHLGRGDYRVRLASGVTLRASRRRREDLQRAIASIDIGLPAAGNGSDGTSAA